MDWATVKTAIMTEAAWQIGLDGASAIDRHYGKLTDLVQRGISATSGSGNFLTSTLKKRRGASATQV